MLQQLGCELQCAVSWLMGCCHPVLHDSAANCNALGFYLATLLDAVGPTIVGAYTTISTQRHPPPPRAHSDPSCGLHRATPRVGQPFCSQYASAGCRGPDLGTPRAAGGRWREICILTRYDSPARDSSDQEEELSGLHGGLHCGRGGPSIRSPDARSSARFSGTVQCMLLPRG